MLTLERYEQGWTWDVFQKRVQMHRNEWRERIAMEVTIPDEFAAVVREYPHPLKVVALTADWCGDALQTTPAIMKLLQLNPNIEVRCFPRDENLDVMDLHLTNGGRAIPKFAIFDANMNDVAQWGPRPAGAQAVMLQAKAGGDTVKEYWPKIQVWYRENHPIETFREWAELFRTLPK